MYKTLRFHYIFIITALVFSVTRGFSQYESRGTEYDYLDAETFYNGRNYYDALPLYEMLLANNPKVIEYQLKIGICHLYLNSSPEKAIEYLQGVYSVKPKTRDIEYYLGKAYALNYKFDLAIETFEKAASNKKTSKEFKENIPHLITQCNNGKELIKDPLPFEVVNIGKPINSSANEYGPTVNSDG